MSREINTLEIEKYSKPDENGRVKSEGMITAKEAFKLLSQHLTANGMYPDEYFLDNSDNYASNDGKLYESPFYCNTNFGSSEGIYIDIFQRDNNGKYVSFATAKTLQDDGDAFIKMSRIAAECSLMLNGCGRKFILSEKDSNIKEYFLSDKETTPYIILEQNKDIALLRRFTPDPKNDPTPYIVVSGLNLKDNNLIEWDFGNYFKKIADATARFTELTEGQKEKRHVNLYSDVETFCDEGINKSNNISSTISFIHQGRGR